MLACARIGAVHTVIFAGFSPTAIHDRVVDAHATVVLCSDEGVRGPKRIPLKDNVDQAIRDLSFVTHVLVCRRTGGKINWHAGRDAWLEEAMASQRPYCPCEWMDAEDPLFYLYTSGSTGKPKGIVHTQAGYLLYASLTHRIVFDVRENDVYACMADMGWITGHSYILYGPLANGTTSVLFEPTPLYPDAGRYWATVEKHKISQFYTSPTAIRALMKFGLEFVTKYNLSSLRVLGSVGEPINPSAWNWYHEHIGKGRCAIVDTFWQTGNTIYYYYYFLFFCCNNRNGRTFDYGLTGLYPHQTRVRFSSLLWNPSLPLRSHLRHPPDSLRGKKYHRLVVY
jgi:acetyl-CoA synthetase